jgi:Right handed beta helix region
MGPYRKLRLNMSEDPAGTATAEGPARAAGRPRPALWLGLAVLAAVATASPGVAGEIRVDCNGGQSLAAALGRAAAGETIIVRGTCRETVTIETDRVTIDGGGQAVVDGVDRTRDVIAIAGARGVTLRGLTVRNGREGLLATSGATFVLEKATVEESGSHGVEILGAQGDLRDVRSVRNGRAGVLISRNSQLDLSNATLTDNLTGLVIFTNSSARLFGSLVVKRNQTQGMTTGLGASIFAIGAAIDANDNGAEGLFLLQGGNLQLIGGTLRTNRNATHGVLLQQGSGLILGIEEFGVPGTAEAIGNGRSGLRAAGESVITASRIMPLTSQGNAEAGVELDDGSSATLIGSTIQSNGAAGVRLLFGARLTVTESTVDAIACDKTALVRGDARTRCPPDRIPR